MKIQKVTRHYPNPKSAAAAIPSGEFKGQWQGYVVSFRCIDGCWWNVVVDTAGNYEPVTVTVVNGKIQVNKC